MAKAPPRLLEINWTAEKRHRQSTRKHNTGRKRIYSCLKIESKIPVFSYTSYHTMLYRRQYTTERQPFPFKSKGGLSVSKRRPFGG